MKFVMEIKNEELHLCPEIGDAEVFFSHRQPTQIFLVETTTNTNYKNFDPIFMNIGMEVKNGEYV